MAQIRNILEFNSDVFESAKHIDIADISKEIAHKNKEL